MGKETPRGLSEEDIVVKEVGQDVKQINPNNLRVVEIDNMTEEERDVYLFGFRPNKDKRYDSE